MGDDLHEQNVMDNEKENLVYLKAGEFDVSDSENFDADYFVKDFFSGDEECQEDNDNIKEGVKDKEENDDFFYTDELNYREDSESEKEEDNDTDILRLHAEYDIDLAHDTDEIRNSESSSSNNGTNQSSNELSPSSKVIKEQFFSSETGNSTLPKQKKRDVNDDFNQEDDDMPQKKKKLPSPRKYKGVKDKAGGAEKRKYIISIIDKIPTTKEELFAYPIDSSLFDNVLMEKRIRPWINKMIIEYVGEPRPILVHFISSKVLVGSEPQSLLNELQKVLDNDEAEVFVVKMWRLLIFEIETKRSGAAVKQEVEGLREFAMEDVASSETSTASATAAEPSTIIPTVVNPSAAKANTAYISQTTKYWCYICNIPNSSQKTLEIHKTGHKHKKKQKDYEIFQKHKIQGEFGTGLHDADITQRGKYWCYICNVPNTSEKNLEIHETGHKHKKKQKAHEIFKNQLMQGEYDAIKFTTDPNIFRCSVCDIDLKLTDADEHLKGIRHLNKARGISQDSTRPPASNSSQNIPNLIPIVPNQGPNLSTPPPVFLSASVLPPSLPKQVVVPPITGAPIVYIPPPGINITLSGIPDLSVPPPRIPKIKVPSLHANVNITPSSVHMAPSDLHMALSGVHIAPSGFPDLSAPPPRIPNIKVPPLLANVLPPRQPKLDHGQHATSNHAQKADVIVTSGSPRTITTDHNEGVQQEYKKRKVCLRYIPKDFPDCDLQKILLACGKNSNFKRIADAGTCCVIYDEIESALRCERLLHNCLIMNYKIQVILPYKDAISQKEREYWNTDLDSPIKKLIYAAQYKYNNRNTKRPGTKTPIRRKNRSVSRSPDRKIKRSRSRSNDRHYRMSRSKSPDRKYRKFSSRERRSEYLESRRIRKKRFNSRSPSNEAKFDNRSRTNELEKSKENFRNTDVGILDKQNIIVTSIMTPIFNECRGKQHLCDLSKTVYRFETHKRARVVYMLLNKFRTPFGRVNLVYSQNVDTQYSEDLQETMLVMGIINETLKKFRQISIEILKELGIQKHKIDPYTFKTEKCMLDVCQNRGKCTFYHNQEQIRRNPSKILYSPHRCIEYRLGSCNLGNMCTKCHSDYELNFHPDMIHKKVCSDWYSKGPCELDFESLDCCINAHPETSEVLFNTAWGDLYIAELKHTYQYLVGAIQNLRFVNTQQQSIYILLVTPSVYMIHWLMEAIQDIATALKFDVHMIANDTTITEKEKTSHVVLCTPDGAMKLLKIPGVSTNLTLAGIILDDVTLLLHRHKDVLETIGKSVMYSTPCIVAVADNVYMQDVCKLSALLYTQFNIIGKVSASQKENDFPSSLTIDSTLSSSNNIRQNESSIDLETQNSICDLSSLSEIKKSNKYIENAQKPKENSATEACQLLRGFCDQIGILGISLKIALEKTEFEHDSDKIFESLSDADSHELLVLISAKIIRHRDETNHSIIKSQYTQACNAIEFLRDSIKIYLDKKHSRTVSGTSKIDNIEMNSIKINMDKQHSRTDSGTSAINMENCTMSRSSSFCFNSDFVMDNTPVFGSNKSFTQEKLKSDIDMDNTPDFDSNKSFTQEKVKSDLDMDNTSEFASNKSFTQEKLDSDSVMDNTPEFDSNKPFNQEEVNSYFVVDNTQKNDSSKLTQEEVKLFQGILGKIKPHGSPSSPQSSSQRIEEKSYEDDIRDSRHEILPNSASYNPISILEMMDDDGDNFDLDISLSLPQRTRDKNQGSEEKPDNTNQSFNNVRFSLSSGDFSKKFNDTMFKVAIFGHEYIEGLPFNSGETFKSKNPENPFQVIKYVKHGAEIFEVHKYDIWKELITAQPNMVFLVLGKNDISKYVSSQNIINMMVKIKSDLEKSIPNVRIVCFGLENRAFDKHWSTCQDKLNRCLGEWFETIIFPTNNIDIGNHSYEAVTKVWRYMQDIIEDIKLQHYMLCKSKVMESKDIGMKDMLSRYIDLLK